jgi:hypothetical protein
MGRQSAIIAPRAGDCADAMRACCCWYCRHAVLRERMAADSLDRRQVKKLKKDFLSEAGFGRFN